MICERYSYSSVGCLSSIVTRCEVCVCLSSYSAQPCSGRIFNDVDEVCGCSSCVSLPLSLSLCVCVCVCVRVYWSFRCFLLSRRVLFECHCVNLFGFGAPRTGGRTPQGRARGCRRESLRVCRVWKTFGGFEIDLKMTFRLTERTFVLSLSLSLCVCSLRVYVCVCVCVGVGDSPKWHIYVCHFVFICRCHQQWSLHHNSPVKRSLYWSLVAVYRQCASGLTDTQTSCLTPYHL